MDGELQPNILLIIADDQRFDTIKLLGNDYIETPNFDSLVRNGCAFTQHCNIGANQDAVCVPARSMVMSGHSLYHLEGPGGMTADHPTLPETFGDAGYRTFGTGKWHNGRQAFNRSFDEGTNIFFGGMGNHWNVPVSDRHSIDKYPAPRPTHGFSGTGSIWPTQQSYDRYASGTHSTELFANATIDFLEDYEGSVDEQPFFAYMATMAPHDPRTCPGEYLSMYDHNEIPLSESFQPEHSFDVGWRGRDENLEDHPRDPEKVRRHIADYYAMITHLDAQVGRVLNTLEEIGERGNTIVAFTADHGLAVGRHGLLGKQNLYDHSIRVPLLLSGPGIAEDERRDALTCHYDLFPTLCDLAGLKAPNLVEGESLVPALDDPEHSPRDFVFLAYKNIQRAVRGDRFKLIEYYIEGDRHTQLFDLEDDPEETTDLSDHEEYEPKLEEMRKQLARAQAEMDDPMSQG